jgi:Domain of unknown function (DUF4350)
MPNTLDAGDRKLLIGAGVLLVVLVISAALLTPRRSEGMSAYPSSYSTNWDGAKGAYLLLQDLGYRVSRWDESPTELKGDASKQVLIFAEPVQAPSPEEKQAIREFLNKGGRILAVGAGASRLLPESSWFQEGNPFDEKTIFRPLLPSPLIRNASEISMVAPDHWRPNSASQLVIYGNDKTAAVITYAVGKGRVIWWGATTPITNAGIRVSGNLALFLNSIGPANGARVLWDEYFHGAHGSLWGYLAQTPLLWGVAQFGLVFLAILATHSRRQAPIHIPLARSRLSPLEFVETLGDLYSSAHAGPAAVRIAYQRLRYQLTRQLGLPSNVPDADLARTAHALLAWNEAEFSGTLSRSQQAMNSSKLDDAATLKITQEIFDYTSRLELKRAPKEERPNG